MNKHIYIVLLMLPIISVADSKFYAVVMAGGVGERLWPLSRQNKPKQFLTINSHKTLLEQSIDRIKPIVDEVWVTIAQRHQKLVTDAVGNKINRMIPESCGRNTGPAILYTCLEIYQNDPDAIVFFMPSDSYIPESDYDQFRKAALQAYKYAQKHNDVVLFGVRPTGAATGYGYIEYEQSVNKSSIFKISRFHEKPSLKLAQNYVKMPHMLWNISIFCGRVAIFIDLFKRLNPELYQQVKEFINGQRLYSDIENISFDYAVMERANNATVLPVTFSWCDVGNVDVFTSLCTKFDGDDRKLITINAKNNVIDVKDKLVALVGVDDLCVIETEDALLITKRNEAERVRAVVKELKEKKQVEYL